MGRVARFCLLRAGLQAGRHAYPAFTQSLGMSFNPQACTGNIVPLSNFLSSLLNAFSVYQDNLILYFEMLINL